MTFLTQIISDMSAIGLILTAMAVITLMELAVPLHRRGRWSRAHLGPNLTLTLITFVVNLLFGSLLAVALVRFQASGAGLLPALGLHPFLASALTVIALDFSFYVAHVAMHKVAFFWRFHRVHHSDPAVDVTTTIRQHPGEGVIRYAFMAAFALPLGVTPAALTLYRALAAINGLLEHANIRAPLRLDRMLSLVTTWPHMHKIHHSRVTAETDTNYGNLFSIFDRLCGTFTPSVRGARILYGLDGLDDTATQTTVGLLVLPFRSAPGDGVARPMLAGDPAGRVS